MSDKILFLKQVAHETRAVSAVVGASGFYWRMFSGSAEIASALQRENFALVLVDHRGSKDDALQFIARLPERAPGTPIFLITAQEFELQKVIQAIRLGVKDVFNPPLDLKAIVERVRTVVQSSTGSHAPMPLEHWSEFVMFLAEGELPEKAGAQRAAGKGTPADLAAKLSLASQERDQLAAERSRLKDEAARAQVRLQALEEENGLLLASAREKDKVAAQPAPRVPAVSQSHSKAPTPAVLEEQLEVELAALAQQQKKFAQEVSTWREAGVKHAAALAQREEDLAEKEKIHAVAAEKFAFELEEMEAAQLIADQAQTKVDQVVMELSSAAEKLKEQRSQMAEEQHQANEKLTRDGQELTTLRAELKKEKAALEKTAGELILQATQLKRTTEQQAADRLALDKASKALAERAGQFDEKQRHVREQMKQLLASSG